MKVTITRYHVEGKHGYTYNVVKKMCGPNEGKWAAYRHREGDPITDILTEDDGWRHPIKDPSDEEQLFHDAMYAVDRIQDLDE